MTNADVSEQSQLVDVPPRHVQQATEPPADASARTKLKLVVPLLISFAFLLIILGAARHHPYGTYTAETDFYQYYAPDAERLLRGQFPEDTYRGPGYPLTLGVLTIFTSDIFFSAKLISAGSAALVGWLTFLLFSRLFGYITGIGAQLLVLLGTHFSSFAVTATTDVFFLMLCLAALVIFLSEALVWRWRVVLSAAITSLAYLTRYNGVFLIVTFATGILALNLFQVSRRERLKYTAVFLGVFILVASPWLIANYRHQGSPFYNTNHLNIATEFYPDIAGGSVFQEGTRGLSERFRSLPEVLRYDPQRIAAKYPSNIWDALRRSIKTDLVDPWVGWFAVAGFVLALIGIRQMGQRGKMVALVLLSGALYLLLVALTHWETRYYFYVMALYAGLAVFALVRPYEWLKSKGWLRSKSLQAVSALVLLGVFGVMWYNSFAASKTAFTKFLSTHPTEIPAAAEFIKSAGIERPRIVARKPHLSYFVQGEWLFIPQVKSLDELKAWLQENRADYLAFGIRELQARPELKTLKDPATAPEWLQPVWTSDNPPFVLYESKK